MTITFKKYFVGESLNFEILFFEITNEKAV